MGDTNPLAGIEFVDWENLQHAYGSAEDVPDCLRRLLSPDKDVREDTLDELYSNIYHQDTRYTASVAAIPFLYRLLDDPKTPDRDNIIELLVMLAVGINTPDEPLGADIVEWLKTEAEMRQPGYLAKRKQRLAEWAAAAAGEKERNSRGFQASDEPEETPSWYFAPFDCYREVQRGLNSMYVCLNDTSPLVRAKAAFALAWFPQELETIHERLLRLLERDGDDAVRATAIISLAVVQCMSETNPNQQLIQRLENEFSSGKAAEIVRWACSLALLKLGTFNKEHTSLLTRKLVDETYLDEYESANLKDTAFPFGDCVGSGITLLAAVEFGALKGSDHPDVVRAILVPLSELYFGIELVLPTTALMMVFDGVKPKTSPAFESPTPLQKEVVIAFANVKESGWQLGNLGMILEEWKLPDTQAEMLRYFNYSAV
jgi:HEAT repeat protein